MLLKFDRDGSVESYREVLNKSPAAAIISMILHPVLVSPVTFFLVILKTSGSFAKFLEFYLIVTLFVFILPTIYVVSLKSRGMTESIDIPEKDDRFGLFFVNLAAYGLSFLALLFLGAGKEVLILLSACILTSIIVAVVTKWWKISIHGATLGGMVSALWIVVDRNFLWLMVTFPLLAWSRVKMKAHSFLQVLVGLAVGFLVTFLCYKLLGGEWT